jgi:hypothetical protein
MAMDQVEMEDMVDTPPALHLHITLIVVARRLATDLPIGDLDSGLALELVEC